MARSKKPKLTDREWETVFSLRCRSKRGERLAPEEQSLVDRAFKEDPSRYADLEPRVFNETVPFGSTVRWGDRKR